MTTDNEKASATSAATETTTIRPRVVEDCDYCKQFGGSVMMPPHFASAGCQSGGRNHCTCDACF